MVLEPDKASGPTRRGRPPLPQLPWPTGVPGTLTRKQVRFADTPATVPVLVEPTTHQREAFDLICARSRSP
jgi:hypothetical protein